MNLKIGDRAPDFSLPDQNGTMHSLSDYAGRWVLLYFYPKDDTPGCTKQACGVRDVYGAFQKQKLAVVGISVDPVKSHRKFSEKYDLPFPLLADEERLTVQAYGVWQKKKYMGREYMGTVRSSFLIDPQGNIAALYAAVKPEQHADQVLTAHRQVSRR